MQPSPSFSSTTTEERWVNYISTNYTINLDTRPCIFQVPHKLRNENPEAYTPRTVGLGPYHHLRPELQEMESQKRDSVKSFLSLKDFQIFIQFVDELHLKSADINGERDSQSLILPHYDTFLDLKSKTLVWILVIDAIFLLQFLQEESNWENQQMAAEIMMLENQIPMVLLKKIMEALNDHRSFPSVQDTILEHRFNLFCNRQTPLKLCEDSVRINAAFLDKKHLLHYLYVLIVENYTDEKPSPQEGGQGVPGGLILCRAIPEVINLVGDVAKGFCLAIQQAQAQGLQIPASMNNVSKLLEQLEKTQNFYDKGIKNLQHGLTNKIDVPSASKLHDFAKINFSCTDGGIRNILFDTSNRKHTLYLPEITLGQTSEVVLRNLVAYEAASKPSGSTLELAQYIDLMCGIIKAEKDVKLLRQSGIIKGNLPDEQIVGIFNGINKTTQIPPEQTEIQRIVQKLSKMYQREKSKTSSKKENDDQDRLTNKIQVPSATQLNEEAKLKFFCRDDGKRKISLDKEKLYLPEIKLNPKEPVRDLAAFDPKEAVENLDAFDPEYFNFMRAIIKNEFDAQILKKEGIIKGNGNVTETVIVAAFEKIGKSVEWPTELSRVQETVQELNKKFKNLRIVKAYKFTKNFIAAFQSWIMLIFPTFVLMLLILQSFCQIYGCRARRSGYAGGSSFGLDDSSEAKLMMPRKVLGYHPNLM